MLSLSRIAHSRKGSACSRKLIDGIRELTRSDMAVCNSHSSNSIISYALSQNLPTHFFTSTTHYPLPTSSPLSPLPSPLSLLRTPLSVLPSTYNQPPPPPSPHPSQPPALVSLLSPPTLPYPTLPHIYLPPHKPHQPRKLSYTYPSAAGYAHGTEKTPRQPLVTLIWSI